MKKNKSLEEPENERSGLVLDLVFVKDTPNKRVFGTEDRTLPIQKIYINRKWAANIKAIRLMVEPVEV
jgi:hypothetical protein